MSKKMSQDLSAQGQTEEITLSPDIIVSFLEDNPEFFNQHPDIVLNMRISDKHRGTVSLVERQQQLLRHKIQGLEEEITQLMAIANQNEQLFGLYSDLYLRLIDCQSTQELLDCLYRTTTELLSLADLKLFLVDQVDISHPCIIENDAQEVLDTRLSDHDYYFGRVQQSEQKLLFSEEIEGSVVMIKLEHSGKLLGFIAIKSQDADHFDPRMDTLLLGQFRKLVAKLLAKHLVE